MKCFICRSDLKSIGSLVKHLKTIHGLCTGRTLTLKCGQAKCSLSFQSFNGFRKHLNKCHTSTPVESREDAGDYPECTPSTCNSTQVEVVTENVESEPSSPDLVNSCASVIADLKAAGVSQSVVNSVMISMEEIVQDINR